MFKKNQDNKIVMGWVLSKNRFKVYVFTARGRWIIKPDVNIKMVMQWFIK